MFGTNEKFGLTGAFQHKRLVCLHNRERSGSRAAADIASRLSATVSPGIDLNVY